MEPLAVMDVFDDPRPAKCDLQNGARPRIELNLPAILGPHLHQPLSRTHIQAVDVTPTLYLRFRHSPRDLHDPLKRQGRITAHTPLDRRLDPIRLLLKLEEYPRTDHDEKGHRDRNRAPTMQCTVKNRRRLNHAKILHHFGRTPGGPHRASTRTLSRFATLTKMMQFVLGYSLGFIYWLFSSTWKTKIYFHEGIKPFNAFSRELPRSIICAHWHKDELSCVRYGQLGKSATMASQSKDGSIIAGTLIFSRAQSG